MNARKSTEEIATERKIHTPEFTLASKKALDALIFTPKQSQIIEEFLKNNTVPNIRIKFIQE